MQAFKIGRIAATWIALALPTLALSQTGQPQFDMNAAETLAYGPTWDAYALQKEVYRLDIIASEPFNASTKKPAQLQIFNQDGTKLHDVPVLMRWRGSSSLSFPKKQYAVSMASGEASPLLDLAAAEDYVLSAPYNDKSLLRDITAYNLFNLMGRYAPKTRIVRASLQIAGGPVQDLGILVLTEKNDLAPGKVDIPKKSADGDVAFLLQIDRVKEDDAGKTITTANGLGIVIDAPKKKDLTEARKASLKARLDRLEATLKDRTSVDWQNLFVDQVNLPSAVDFFIAQELARNVDAYRLSSPFYIPIGGLINFGPIWDFNLGFGNADYGQGYQTYGWRAAESGVWFQSMMRHPQFCEALKLRWTDLRSGSGLLSTNTISHVIDQHAALMKDHVDANFAIWGGLGVKLWPNPYWLPTWAEETKALQAWLALRTQWMDSAVAAWNCGS
jgi:hypothetical protein